MIECDDQWTPQVTVIGIGELGVRVLLKLSKKQREELNLCAIVSDKTHLEGHENQFSAACVGDACLMEQQSDLHQIIQNDVMLFIVADMEDTFSARVALDIASKELKFDSICNHSNWRGKNIVSFALLIMPDGTAGQDDYINQTRAIYMMSERLNLQCELQPRLFEDETDVIAETVMRIAVMPVHNLFGMDVHDIQEAFSRPGKVATVFGQGNTVEDAVDNLLLTVEKIGLDFRRCKLAVFSISGADNRLSIYDVGEAPCLIAKKMGRTPDSFFDGEDYVTLLSAQLDESLGDKLQMFVVFCEGDEKSRHSD